MSSASVEPDPQLGVNGDDEDCVGVDEFGGSCAGEVAPHQSMSGMSWSYRCALHQCEYVERQQAARERAFWRTQVSR